jgi:HD superfamily phosphohydrolase
MYWQVYLHKTVLSAEKMLIKIIQRATELIASGEPVDSSSLTLNFFLHSPKANLTIDSNLDKFCRLDDYDVVASIKNWMFHKDKILSILCAGLIERRLLKVKLQAEPWNEDKIDAMRDDICRELSVTKEESSYFIFAGEAMNTTYDPYEGRINILFKDNSVKDISQVDNALIRQTISRPVKKFYICYFKT